MPSRFPGMDPYLEATDLWGDVHFSLMTRIWAQLTHRLPDGFRARVEKWVRVEQEPERFRPDVTITTAPSPLTEEIPPYPYRVSLHRAGQGERFEVGPISLRSPLPEVRIPPTQVPPLVGHDASWAENLAG